MNRALVFLALVLIGGCVAEPRGAVRPAPPGPLDVIRGGVWGDYSGLCPKHYEFCHGGRRSICCPGERGCCEDASGPYCCSSVQPRGEWYGERDEDDRGSSEYGCDARDIMCSQGGRTICCSRQSRCCADEDGPYCCGSSGDRGGPPRY